MAEKVLTLEAVLKMTDRFTGPMARARVSIERFQKGVNAAEHTLKAMAPIGVAATGAIMPGNRGLEGVQRAMENAAPLEEARTRFEQIAGAQKPVIANAAAFDAVRRYGAASWQDELDSLTQAYQLYGNLNQAIAANDAANKLTLATRQRALGLALQRGMSLDQFIAQAAEVTKAEGAGALRDLFTEFQPPATRKGAKGAADTHYSARAAAIHQLMQTHAADRLKMQGALEASKGAADRLASAEMRDAAQRIEQSRRVSEALSQAGPLGTGLLDQRGSLARFQSAVKAVGVSAELAHPNVTTASGDLYAVGAEVAKLAGLGASGVITIRMLSSAYEEWFGKLGKTTEAINSAASASGALGKAAGLAARALGGLGQATMLIAVSKAAGAAFDAVREKLGGGSNADNNARPAAFYAAHPRSLAARENSLLNKLPRWLGPGGVEVPTPPKMISPATLKLLASPSAAVAIKTAAPVAIAAARGDSRPREIHVHVDNSGDQTINVSIPPGTDKQTAIEIVQRALEAHDSNLQKTLKRAVDDAETKSARTAFSSAGGPR